MTCHLMRRTIVANIFAVLLMVVVLTPAMTQTTRERIAFQRDASPDGAPANVVVMFTDNATVAELPANADLTYPRITPALSPDGHLLAFASKVGEHFKIFTWALDEQNNATDRPVRLSTDEDADDKFPAWSPDGQRLTYLAIDANKKATLRIINKDGTDMKVLQEGITYFSTPSWSSDGSRLLIIDNVMGKPTLRTVSIENLGMSPISIRPKSKIITACYSPDGTRIAAIVAGKIGFELWSLPLSGITDKNSLPLLDKINGCANVAWLPSGVIVFNATSVGTQQDNSAFWFINPVEKKIAKSISAYAPKTSVRYFSACTTVVTTPKVAAKPPTPTPVIVPVTVTPTPPKHVVNGAIALTSPDANATVNGKVMLQMITQANVATIVLRIGTQNGGRYEDKYSYAMAVEQSGKTTTTMTHEWDTQELITVDPTRELPQKYAYFLRYPDQSYTLSVQAFSKDHKSVGTDSVTVTVANSLPDNSLPPNLSLHYNYVDPAPEEHFLVHGEGNLTGAYTQYTDSLDVSLDAMVRRDLVEIHTSNYDVRTYLDPVGNAKYTLSTDTQQSTIPEQYASALYSLTQSGDLSVISQRRKRLFLPLSQIVIPFPQDPVRVGSSWSKQMWVVSDLLARDASLVHAMFTVDGAELINGHHTVRIRAEYHLDSPTKLALRAAETTPGLPNASPTEKTPGAIGTAQVLPRGFMPPSMQNMPLTGTGANSISVNNSIGLRYAWFDIEKNKLVRVEDRVLYTFQVPYQAPPVPTPKVSTGGPAVVNMTGHGTMGGADDTTPDTALPIINVPGKGMVQVQRDSAGQLYAAGLGRISEDYMRRMAVNPSQPMGMPTTPPPAIGMQPAMPATPATTQMVTVRYLVQYSYNYQPAAGE